MMLTVTVQNKEAVNKCRDAVREIADNERQNITKSMHDGDALTKMKLEDHHVACESLRYVLFQKALGEAYGHLSAACRALDMSDEELSSMCATRGETVQSAFKNAMTNMMMEVITSMMTK